MDNEKKPEFLEKILKQGGNKAVNENPALDQKKVLEPLKDASTTLPEEKEKPQRIVKSRAEEGTLGRGKGGGSSEPKVEGEKKTPTQKILEKGGQKSWGGRRGGSSGRGGATILREPDEILKEKQDAVNPEEPLSHKRGEKPLEVANVQGKNQPEQKKQESQPQQAQHKPTEKDKKILSPRERANLAREAKEKKAKEVHKPTEVVKDVKQVGIRERIANATAIKNSNTPAKTSVTKKKNIEVAIKKVKSPSPKSPKR